ncbi:efflux RND transporter periplasmic adaptor subunit [Pseudomonas sp. SP16.1]|jgi:Cu(I)/Ag(I) efflux system membrane fusion protein|uniref:efflux RND transporter periplasmic adaptor subunit n=1 Tax=Pseudomonadaceae TaxID=135621 RepID=UPI000B4991FB|nr:MULTISPECIES: efflux RND transporter periplasmic adaptor subunit [Pseudomonas]OWJ96216.1 efflux transporter periplasmic adaptor subunit [Pseudomonas sp. A46]WAG76515.1 efflux RND transporter periplasmic adaptor subunit [Pseudomonas furukawaii]
MKISALGFSAALLTMGIAAAGGGYLLAERPANHEVMPTPAPTDERKVLYWYDPMQPEQRFDKPGKSPFMDMELVPKYADAGQDSSTLSVPSQAVQNLGMRTAPVTRGVLPSGIEAVGSLVYNQREVANLQARAGGFVERVYGHAPGDVLPAGTPLVDLLIPEWSAAQLEFLAVLRTADTRLISATQERMRLLGMPQSLVEQVRRSGRPRAVQTITTPIAGELQALDVRVGMTVAAGQDLARINGLSTVWLDTAIPEDQAGAVQFGASITATLTAFPEQPLPGRVVALLPSADPQTRTLTVRSELANPAGKLRPGMFAAVRLNSTVEQPALLIPSEAVIRTGKRALVMLAEADGRYRPLEITLGREADGRLEVLSGLEEGQSVVTSGQFLIDSEASLQGVVASHVEQDNAKELHESHGVIRALDAEEITLEHGPFESLNMPGMTMAFPLASPEVAAGLKPGDHVRIGARQTDSGLQVERLDKQGELP